MMQLFDAHPAPAPSERRAAYRAYLIARNGDLDLLSGKLLRREARSARFGATAPRGAGCAISPNDAATRLDRTRSYPGDELLVLALSRVHAIFGFGAPCEYPRALGRAYSDGDEVEAFVAAEHAYGARLLAGSAPQGTLATRPRGRQPGPLDLTLLPERLGARRWMASVAFAAEIVHTVALLNLLRVTGEVLRASTGDRERTEERLLDVLTDAVGHVSFRRLGLDPNDLERTQRILPALALVLGHRSPEMAALGASVFPSAETMAHRLEHSLPAEVRAQAFLAA